MTVIAGRRLNDNQHIWIGLTQIFGVGRTRARVLCERSNIDPSKKVKDLSPDDIEMIRSQLTASGWEIETTLRRSISKDIQNLKAMRCLRGRRHVAGLPVRGQNTQKNAKTARRRRRDG